MCSPQGGNIFGISKAGLRLQIVALFGFQNAIFVKYKYTWDCWFITVRVGVRYPMISITFQDFLELSQTTEWSWKFHMKSYAFSTRKSFDSDSIDNEIVAVNEGSVELHNFQKSVRLSDTQEVVTTLRMRLSSYSCTKYLLKINVFYEIILS